MCGRFGVRVCVGDCETYTAAAAHCRGRACAVDKPFWREPLHLAHFALSRRLLYFAFIFRWFFWSQLVAACVAGSQRSVLARFGDALVFLVRGYVQYFSPVGSVPPFAGFPKMSVVKEGWLLKRGEYISTWRPRYFVLKSDGKFLGFKQKPLNHEDPPVNKFDTRDCKISLEDDKDRNGKFGFSIRFVQMTRVIERSFHTESIDERKQWVDAINAVKQEFEGEDVRRGALRDTRAMSFIGGKPQPTDIGMESFEMLKVLGKGSFGKVMLATLKSSGAVYAIKVLKKSMILESNELAHTFTENSVLAKSSHPFLTSLHYSFQTADLLCFVMEYVNGGELFFHLRKEKRFNEDRTRFYIGEILLALTYLHDQGIIYRDLKLENLLLDSSGHIKITDFGLCKEEITYGSTTRTFCGTPEYLAPEVILDLDYGLPVDWWGLGVVTYEMLSGKLPFNSQDYEELFEMIVTRDVIFPPTIDGDAKASFKIDDLLEKLLVKDPTQRFGSCPRDGHEIQEHPWFAPIDFEKLYNREIPAPFLPKVKSATDVSNFDDHFTREAPNLTPPNSDRLDPDSNNAFKDFDTIKPQANLA
eukprot:gene7545-7704_t